MNLLFCPKCFVTEEKLSLAAKNGDKYKCPVCKEEYPVEATLVSELTVRTYIMAAPKSTKHIEEALDKIIKEQNATS